MTLKEKYLDLLKDYNPDYKNTEAKGCEKIADEFAIGFADWLNNGRFSQYGIFWINPKKNKDKDGYWVLFTSKELLEIYKKEKGL